MTMERTDPIEQAVDVLNEVSRSSGAADAATVLQKLLGHPAHPMLTDLPIGFWTSSFALDVLGLHEKASRLLMGLGLLSAVPTVVTGLGDAPAVPVSQRRLVALHVTANVVGTTCYLVSWIRRRGNLAAGRRWSLAGATAATVAGWAGGKLAFPPSQDA